MDKPLVSQFILDGKIQKVEYECLPRICFACGRYEHVSGACPEKKDSLGIDKDIEQRNPLEGQPGEQRNTLAKDAVVGAAENNPTYGPWMIASRKGRPWKNMETKKFGANQQFYIGKFGEGYRFNVLNPAFEP